MKMKKSLLVGAFLLSLSLASPVIAEKPSLNNVITKLEKEEDLNWKYSESRIKGHSKEVLTADIKGLKIDIYKHHFAYRSGGPLSIDVTTEDCYTLEVADEGMVIEYAYENEQERIKNLFELIYDREEKELLKQANSVFSKE